MNLDHRFYVGIDWASEEHAVCILNEKREVLEQKKFEHTGSGLAQLTDRLLELSGGEPTLVAAGIETPRGAVVETLVERGFHVYSLNPKQMDRFDSSLYSHSLARRIGQRGDATRAPTQVQTRTGRLPPPRRGQSAPMR
jgi:hypothetical protein